MSSLSQIMRNSFIRLEGFVTFQLKKVFGFFSRILSFFRKLFGFTEPEYFLEEAQKIKPDIKPDQVTTATPSDNPTTRRRPDANMDYYLKLAQPKKTSS